MNRPQTSGSAALLVAVLLLGLIVIGAGGLAIGFFVARDSAVRTSTISLPATAIHVAPSAAAAAEGTGVVARFKLSERDVKDTLESPVIVATPQGSVLVAYASQTGESQRKLYVARSTDQGQSFPELQLVRQTAIYTSVSQMKGKEVRRSLRLLPQLAVAGDKVYLGWIEPNTDNTTVIYYVAESSDDGVTFGEPQRVHESDGARPTFVGLTGDREGNLLASWLDHRAGVQQPFAALRRAGESTFQPETQVYAAEGDRGVCPCCPTAALLAHGQMFVAFRNQLNGYRDIYVGSRSIGGEGDFDTTIPVRATPTWMFDGCPHDGPSLAADSRNLLVAWMDASSGTPRCYYTFKPLGGGNFAEPRAVDEGADPETAPSQGNIRAAIDPQGDIVLAWESSIGGAGDNHATASSDDEHQHGAPTGSGRAIILMRLSRDESPQAGDSFTASSRFGLAPKPGVFQTRPALTVLNDGTVLVAFNQLDENGKQVIVARFPRR